MLTPTQNFEDHYTTVIFWKLFPWETKVNSLEIKSLTTFAYLLLI